MSSQSNILSFEEMRRISYASSAGESSRSYVPSREDAYAAYGYAAPAPAVHVASVKTARDSFEFEDDYPAVEEYWSDAAVAARERAEAATTEPDRKPSRFASLKRAVTKRRADRKYEKSYGDAAAAAPTSEAGPRAAVYKGKMGTKQRQAARMLEQDDLEPSRRRGTATFPWLRVAACFAVVAFVAFSCAVLYPSAQEYYLTLRTHDLLEAEYEAVVAYNDELSSQIEALQTDSGIEQAARESLGWVMEGETLATVEGLSSSADDETTTMAASILASDDVELPETWYSIFLDPFFGVE